MLSLRGPECYDLKMSPGRWLLIILSVLVIPSYLLLTHKILDEKTAAI